MAEQNEFLAAFIVEPGGPSLLAKMRKMTPRRRKSRRRRRQRYREVKLVRAYCKSPLGKQRLAAAMRKLDDRPPNTVRVEDSV